eukprot:3034863-Pleurochrysis_carterae.AAC.2
MSRTTSRQQEPGGKGGGQAEDSNNRRKRAGTKGVLLRRERQKLQVPADGFADADDELLSVTDISQIVIAHP